MVLLFFKIEAVVVDSGHLVLLSFHTLSVRLVNTVLEIDGMLLSLAFILVAIIMSDSC